VDTRALNDEKLAGDVLAGEQYLSLVTFRRDGSQVATPVWFAGEDGCYYVFTAGDAWKVKRLGNDRRVRVAPCAVLGRITGQWLDGEARLLDGNDAVDVEVEARAWALLKQKYGWQLAALDLLSRFGGRQGSRRMIEITLAVAGATQAVGSGQGDLA